MIRGGPANSPAEVEYDLEIGKERIRFRSGRPGRVEPVTSSSRGWRAHARHSAFCVLDEIHHRMPSNGGTSVPASHGLSLSGLREHLLKRNKCN
jgi:hypothetical protein